MWFSGHLIFNCLPEQLASEEQADVEQADLV
jgi:hypothetical protein